MPYRRRGHRRMLIAGFMHYSEPDVALIFLPRAIIAFFPPPRASLYGAICLRYRRCIFKVYLPIIRYFGDVTAISHVY